MASLAEGIGIGLLIPFLAVLMGAATPDGGFVEIADRYAALFDEDTRLVMVSITIVTPIVGKCLLDFLYVRLPAILPSAAREPAGPSPTSFAGACPKQRRTTTSAAVAPATGCAMPGGSAP